LKVEDKISALYRKQVDELLENQDGLYYYGSLDQEELDKIWEEISGEIDIEEIWNKISSDLDIVMPVDSGSGMILKFFAAVLIVLTALIPVKKILTDRQNNQLEKIIEIEKNNRLEELIIPNNSGSRNYEAVVKKAISPALKSPLNKKEYDDRPGMSERNKPGTPHESAKTAGTKIIPNRISDHLTDDSNLAFYIDNTTIERSVCLPVIVPEDNLKNISFYSKSDFIRPVIPNNSFRRNSVPLASRSRFSIGLTTLIKNTWLLNNETFDGLKSETLNTSEIVFFPDIGISLNYSLNKSWQIQSDGFFFSNTGQKYFEYYYGHYSRKEITLRYSTFDLLVKYRITGNRQIRPRLSINALAGGYLSSLNYAHQRINSDFLNISSQYGKVDYGIRLGGELEIQLFDHFSVVPGLFISLGIPNIYKGTEKIPGYLRSTHNGSAYFQLAFYYHFD
jgi:hypothetical protein